MKKHIRITGIILTIVLSTSTYGQKLDFKLLGAYKTSELKKERQFVSELLEETNTLPDSLSYLIIMAEISLDEGTLKIKSEDVTIGEEKKEAIGKLNNNNRADTEWGLKGYFYEGPNYFTAIFIVDNELRSTKLNILDKSYKIAKISEQPAPATCTPKVELQEKEYVNSISYEKDYREGGNQNHTINITPRNGKLLKLSLSIEFCTTFNINDKQSFVYLPSYFMLQGEDGKLYDCIGTFRFGELSRPTIPSNISKKLELKSTRTLVFNVPEEGSYKLVFLDETVKVIK